LIYKKTKVAFAACVVFNNICIQLCQGSSRPELHSRAAARGPCGVPATSDRLSSSSPPTFAAPPNNHPHNRQDGVRSYYDRVCLLETQLQNYTNDHHSVDNSEASRNGDYVPSRWEAQSDAVNLIFSSKTNANPESSVGLMTMGGNQPEILTTLTTDIGKVLDGLHRTKIKGSSHFVTGINVAAVSRYSWRVIDTELTQWTVGAQAQAEQVAEAADNHL
jgi:hypothetical protein